ncbi:cation-translocating P-type ATPase [Nocardia flavorosea]|uniref:cation-translocating P-type ATPase n=1 Tax=Nocardia flavorosea TaxID=53429 RepID=UPI0018962C11|nr:cation-translocating P-type ATPase [Nocardia flavorosea]MBF6347742.1 cation-translocating P-type ATPase [Nocardia flavorosea]
MAPTVRSLLSPQLITTPVATVTGAMRSGAQRAVDTGLQVVETPVRTAEKMATTLASGIAPLLPGRNSELRDDLAALLDPRDRRAQRRVAFSEDKATIEVQGLDDSHRSAVTGALEQHLGRLRGVQWWRVNAVTGRIVTALSSGADLDRLLAEIEAVERESDVADAGWSRAVEFPADREPVIAAAIEVAGDICAIAISAAGTVPPLRGFMRGVRSVAAFTDAQPRVRRHLEERLGSTRTDLLLAVANAAGAALGEGAAGGVTNLVADTVQRGFALTEAVARHAQWREWETDIVDADHFRVDKPLPRFTRPTDMPRGPVERVADETSAAALAGATTLAGLGRAGDIADALILGAPKAARAGREVYSATVSTTLAAAGVLTLHPAAWRRFDRLTAVVVDAESLATTRRVVLEAASADPEWPDARVWSSAQRLLWELADRDGDELHPLRLVHPHSGSRDRGGTTNRPVERELRDGDRVVGQVLVGRELDPRAHGVLTAARRAGLRIVLAGHRDAAELRGLADEFVSARGSLSAHVERLQQDGHAVAVLSTRAHKALDHADVAIGLIGCEGGGIHVPWSADLLCRNLEQVRRTLAAVGPARQVSERGRTLALSACSLTGLILAAAPAARSRTAPMIAANFAGLFNGAVTGLRAARPDAVGAPAPLLPWHALEPDEVLSRLPEPASPAERQTDEPTGRGALIPNALAPITGYLGHMRRELADPLTPVLGVGAVATAILGAPSDAVLLSSVLTVNAMISARQRQAAENELQELLEGEQLTGRVIDRADIANPEPAGTEVPADCLEIGDVFVVRAGEVVPADARLLRTEDLEMDESGLTGESVTVPKGVEATPGAVVGDRACLIFEGTTVVSGSAVAVVVAVGADTQAGRATAGAVPPDKGGVQAQLRSLTDRALPLTLTGGAIVTALGGLRGRTLRAAISDGVGVAVAAVPEGLPLVATVAQLAAARRLSRYGVLVRANRAVEALGRVDELCFDKTGTLTEGRLRLTALADLDEQWQPDSDSATARRLLRAAARACPEPDDGPVLHATDRAVLDAAAETLGSDAHRWDPLDEIPFESNRGYAAAFGQTARKLRLMVKGAPEVVLPRCTRVRTGTKPDPVLTDELRERADATLHDLAEQGLRVLVVARRDLPEHPQDMENAVEELTLLGFLGIADTPRPQTPYLVRALQDNGVGVRMITGDHPVTAAAVARQLGITVDTVTTGADLDELDETDRTALIERSTVFARVDPEQKVGIVTALRRNGHVVGMTGDGSNDAAAIRTADIGIGIAAHGSAAARNAADLVLTEPDPRALLHALVEGRSMWQRVADSVAVLVGGNAGEIAFTLFGTAVGGRAPLGTRQFLLVNLLTDMFPALALALAGGQEGVEPQDDPEWVEARARQLAAIPPASLGSDLIRTIAVRGVATATGASAAWLVGRYTGTQRRADTIGLVALIGTQLGQTLVAGYRSPLVWLTTAASGAVLGIVVMTPGLGAYFGCTPLGPIGWSVATTAAAGATAGSTLLPRLLPAAETARPEVPALPGDERGSYAESENAEPAEAERKA